MEIKDLDKTHHTKSQSSKYFMSKCSDEIKKSLDTTSWLTITNIIQKKRNLYILDAILDKVDSVVIKVGDRDTILKEYKTAQLLQNIDGFIKYYCYFSCNNEFKQIDIKKTLCDNPGDATKILVMKNYTKGSVGKYIWNNDNFNALQSILKQIIICLLLGFKQTGFIHNDTHLDNFLLDDIKEENITYNGYNIPVHGLIAITMDFENCLIAENKEEYYFLYTGILQILNELDYTLKLKIDNINTFIVYIDTHRTNNTLIDINKIISFIDALKFISKKLPPKESILIYYT